MNSCPGQIMRCNMPQNYPEQENYHICTRNHISDPSSQILPEINQGIPYYRHKELPYHIHLYSQGEESRMANIFQTQKMQDIYNVPNPS